MINVAVDGIDGDARRVTDAMVVQWIIADHGAGLNVVSSYIVGHAEIGSAAGNDQVPGDRVKLASLGISSRHLPQQTPSLRVESLETVNIAKPAMVLARDEDSRLSRAHRDECHCDSYDGCRLTTDELSAKVRYLAFDRLIVKHCC